MAVIRTPRFTLPTWTAGTDPYPGRVGFNEIMELLEGSVTLNTPGAALVFPSGPVSSRPRSGTFGRFFMATDQGGAGRLYYDGGTGWIELNTNGGGGAGMPVVVGGVGAEGSSERSARADHTHALVMATAATHGALSSEHFALLAGATMQTTARTLALRDASGRLSAAAPNPTVTGNVATVGYLNTRLGSTQNGTWDSDPNTPVVRGSDATFYVGEPTKPANPTTKRYVDGRVSREEWKTHWRPMPYGLDEILNVDTGLYDYLADEAVPAEARGQRNVLGSTVENVAEVMPLLVIDGQDGAPERIKDRDLIWPLIAAVQELSAEVDALREQLREVHPG